MGIKKMDKETFVSEALKAQHKLVEADPGYQFKTWTEEDEKLGAVISQVRDVVAASVPTTRPFNLFIEDWETALITNKNNGIYPRRIYDKYVGMFFFDDDDTNHFKIIDLQFNRRQWRVTSAPLELDEETGEVTLVMDGESDLENYEINEILHEMILACKLNKGFAFITSRPEPRRV
jgi:hypothetical protein